MARVPCPSRNSLSGYVHGNLPAPAAGQVAAHLETCSKCEATVVDLESEADSVVANLRQPAGGPFAAEQECRAAIAKAAALPPQEVPLPGPKSPELVTSTASFSGVAGGVGLAEFVTRLTASGVLSADAINAVVAVLPARQRPTDGRSLATVLIAAGKLTKFQAAHVYQDQAQRLVYGDYVLVDKLGAGGMGQVFKAHHRRMKRTVALKIIHSKSLQQPDAAQRFQREVEAAARLNHPHIVTAYDAGEQDGKHFLVMEFVGGDDLASVLKQQGPLPVADAVNYIIQAGQGLAYAHQKGVIHRDIKPNNLLLSTEGVIKILDMGLARIDEAAAPGQFELTESGQVMGTVDYMAPEQALDTKTADARSDLYSLGCTLYRLITNKPMYEGETAVARIFAHRDQPIPSLHALRPDVPEALDRIAQRMVAKRPADRYQTMQECVAALKACSIGVSPVSPAPHPPSVPPPLPPPITLPRGLRFPPPKALAIAGGVLAALLLIVATVIIIRFSDGTTVVKIDGDESVEVDGIKINPRPTQPPDAKPRMSRDTSPSAGANDPSRVVDLLKLVDVNRDAVKGKWTLTADGLASDGTVPFCRLKLPYEPPREYDFRVEFTAQGGNDILQLLTSGGRDFTWLMGAWGGRHDGFDMVKGHPLTREGTNIIGGPTSVGRGQRHTSVIEVRKDSVTARIDGKLVVRHPTDAADLGMPREWSIGEGAIGLGTTFDAVVFHKVEISVPAEGDKQLSQQGWPADAPPAAVTPFDEATGKKHQENRAKQLGMEVEITNSIGMKLVLIPAGTFIMGSPPGERGRSTEEIPHEVEITRSFYLGVTEVAQEEYERVMGANPSAFKLAQIGRSTKRFPVENVSWDEAQDFCRALSARPDELQASRNYRLPTEAEWEYACRGGSANSKPFYFDKPKASIVAADAILFRNLGMRTTDVGSYKPNAFGLYDMHGSVWELCADWYDKKYYASSPRQDPTGPSASSTGLHVVRGGSWTDGDFNCRAAARAGIGPDRSDRWGFRVVCEVSGVRGK